MKIIEQLNINGVGITNAWCVTFGGGDTFTQNDRNFIKKVKFLEQISKVFTIYLTKKQKKF